MGTCSGPGTGTVRLAPIVSLLVFLLAGCVSYESAYEKAVYDEEPLYCYRSLAAVDCYRKPDRRSDTRLVNYYGPAPARTRPPKLPPAAELQAPPEDEGPGKPAVLRPAAADDQARPSDEAQPSSAAWSRWLPFVSLGFGALQVIAAFVL